MKIDKAVLLETLNNPDELKRLWSLNRPLRASNNPENTTEHNLADWLGRLKLLHGVPFNYLVPDVDMLPMESIRFFHCDTTWLNYLVEGALSIGRSASSDNAHDKAFLPRLHMFSRRAMKAERGNVLGHLSGHLSETEHRLLNAEPNKAPEIITGFLLRSGIISDWEGLQVAAFTDAGQKHPCQLLRMDHLSPNVLLCMYEGVVKSIRINEQPEGMHFGFENPDTEDPDKKPASLEKSFRYLVDKQESGQEAHKAGTQVDTAVAPALKADDYTCKDSGVVQINKLVTVMTETLKEKIGYQDSFTAAEFALEMVAGAEAVKFIIAKADII
jgi:hypothetical protein